MLVEHLMTARFRGIYAFSTQIGTKKRVNTYIFMKVIPLFSYPLSVHFTPGRHGRGRQIWIDLIIEKKCERKQDFLVLRWRWTTWCISQRSEFVSTWCGWQGQRPDINIRKGHVNYNLEIINDPRIANCNIRIYRENATEVSQWWPWTTRSETVQINSPK